MTDNESKELSEVKIIAETALKALDDKKALEPTILHVGKHTVLADYFVIATGTSNTHVRALADEVEFKINETLSIQPNHIEGMGGNTWMLLDYGSVVVHVFTKTARDFYKLDKLWADADTDIIKKDIKK
jgi:ribosome-associated protein